MYFFLQISMQWCKYLHSFTNRLPHRTKNSKHWNNINSTGGGLWVIGSACRRDAISWWEVARKTFSETTVTEWNRQPFVVFFRFHVTWRCKVHVYNRKIKVTYFPGLDLFSGDHRDERRRPPPAPEVRSTQQPSRKWIKKPRGEKNGLTSTVPAGRSRISRPNLPKEVPEVIFRQMRG